MPPHVSRIDQIRNLVDSYVRCWAPTRPNYFGIFEDNDFGCEGLQVFRNGFSIETLRHEEISQLTTLLTRELRGQINADHKIFWAWCGQLPQWHRDVELFGDLDWVSAFQTLVHISLASQRRHQAGPAVRQFYESASRYVNSHLMTLASEKHLINAPLSLAILEGLLRRKNGSYIDISGMVRRQFTIIDSHQQSQAWAPSRRLNRIDDSLRLFEQHTTADRSRACIGLTEMKQEILGLYPGTSDVYDLLDSWRNDLVHGKDYWKDRVPIILNLTCLLVLDEIDSSRYDGKLNEIQRHLSCSAETARNDTARAPWEIYPPDLG